MNMNIKKINYANKLIDHLQTDNNKLQIRRKFCN